MLRFHTSGATLLLRKFENLRGKIADGRIVHGQKWYLTLLRNNSQQNNIYILSETLFYIYIIFKIMTQG